MDKLNFRTLQANEIDCRIATVKENGVSLLLYKDARDDMNILDEVMGPMNWQRAHTRDNANCVVSLWDEDKKQWIGKEDTGTESFSAKEKGLASDSFKRACFCWGIGRELYTAPFIWINSNSCTFTKQGNKATCYDDFYVSQIGYDDNRNINSLVICRQKDNKEVFKMGKKVKAEKPEEKEPEGQNEPQKLPDNPRVNKKQVNELLSECDRIGKSEKAICALYKVKRFSDMEQWQYENAMKNFRVTPDKPIVPADPATIPPENADNGLPFK
ncbi:MAG TPA: hypothetical protein DC053_23525 [Lachnoclostridium sp.]|nr:hypothetical protein [Lachnoclostridium sp.]